MIASDYIGGVGLIGLEGVNLVFLTVSSNLISTFPMLPDPISYSESESLLQLQRFFPLALLFLDCLLRLVQNTPHAPGRLFEGVGCPSALGRDLTRIPNQNQQLRN